MNIEALEQMLAKGMDSPMLRFGLGKAYFDADRFTDAIGQFQRCVELDPSYSAAWKLLGKAQLQVGAPVDAAAAWRRGLLAAQSSGDKQTEKELTVFLKKLNKTE
ncbi:MAG: tetratricopeptide repeat protein [Zhongshania sp.]|uniref:tetratricopeptide repeat protein n=1 Tax=Zhongshania sp. TaxID=1971902 RepID=UPI0026153137|nr:tetratricopeptide repeat protein [Zhongshania sp.]MDF1692734.1 tetratricopeptide repeat protein [Zhongshania sp.]